MTRRYYMLFFVISLIIAIATTSMKLSKNKIAAAAGAAYNAESIEQLISESPLIIIADVVEEKEAVKEDGIQYKVSKVHVVEILKGNILLNSHDLNLMQMDIPQDPAVKKGERVLLFLKQYKGKGYYDGYVCVGLGQGYYTIQDKKVEPSTSLSYSLKKSIEDQKDILEYIKLQAAKALE